MSNTINKGSKAKYVKGVEVINYAIQNTIQNNVTHVEGIKSGVCGFYKNV